MKQIELTTTSKPLSAYAKEFDTETVILTLNSKVTSVITSIKAIDPESLSLISNPEFLAIIQNSRQEFNTCIKLSLEEIKRENFC